MYELVHDIIT